MKIRPLLVFLLLPAIASCIPQPPPQPKVDVIPVPPAQGQAWTPPPTKLPPLAITAITELFSEGLADPRGLEYREIEVKAGLDELHLKTHGWILPGTGQGRFAVGWNGLIYPVVTLGPPADVPKDVADLVAKDQKQWKSHAATDPNVRGDWIAPEWVSVSCDNLLPLKAAMLLRLGRTDLAESVWNQWFSLSTGGDKDPYLLLAREWTGTLYDHALFAHLRGDDAVSLAACRILLPLISTVGAVAAQRGFPQNSIGKPYLKDLEELPKLAADQERRALEPPCVPVLQSGQPAQGPERIAALIHDLELVAARQTINPGQTDVSNDPIVAALIKEGDPAVEPLLQCFEEDTRLTRSEFTQGMQIRHGPIIPVYEPAFAAIVGILKTPFDFSDSDNTASGVYREPSDSRDRQPRDLSLADRKLLAGKIRAYWDPNKSLSPTDRWYATLQDDAAGVDAWFLAVDNIVQPGDVSTTPRTMFGGGWSSWGGSRQKTTVILQGESLRARTSPSVSDLIIKRFKQAIAQSASDKNIAFDSVGKLILALADWDGKAHLDDLREMAQAFHARFPHEQGSFVSSLQTEAAIYRKRLALGDPRALQDYADWLAAIDPTGWRDFDLTNPFQIMWHNPNDPVIRQAAEKMFDGENAPWSPLQRVQPVNGAATLADLATTPLIGLPAFRHEVLRRLDDRSINGTVERNENGNMGCMLTDNGHENFTVACPKGDPLAPAVGDKISFRTCDWFAYELSQLDGFPQIGLYWPPAQRDAAVAACQAFLTQHGDAFQAQPGDPYDDSVYANNSKSPTHLHFPRLDHPATPEDVKQGRAIFSLSGITRICPMPDFPIAAWRPGRKTDPFESSGIAADGTCKSMTMYNTEGRVWQAEEVLRDGKWERYFGFAGRYQLEKVPAAELGFFYLGVDGNVTREIKAILEGPPDYVKDEFSFEFATHDFAGLNSPLPVKVTLSNGSGLDQVVPPALMTPAGAKMTLPKGISLSLSYSEKIPPKVTSFSDPPFDYGPWQDIPLRKEVQIAPDGTAGPTLGPARDFTVLDLDLRDFFDASRSGTYRVKAIFHAPNHPEGKSNEITFSIAGPKN